MPGDGPRLPAQRVAPLSRTPSDAGYVTANNLDFNQEITHPLPLPHLWVCQRQKPRQENPDCSTQSQTVWQAGGTQGSPTGPLFLPCCPTIDMPAKAGDPLMSPRYRQAPVGTQPWGSPPWAPGGPCAPSGYGELARRPLDDTGRTRHLRPFHATVPLAPANPRRQVGCPRAGAARAPGQPSTKGQVREVSCQTAPRSLRPATLPFSSLSQMCQGQGHTGPAGLVQGGPWGDV